MVTLNIRLSNFRLTAAAPATLSAPTTLSVWSTTRRICGVESPPAAPPPGMRHAADLVFSPAWSPTWSEYLPDRLALRAAALHLEARAVVKPPKLRRLAACAPRRTVPLGALRLDLLSLAAGTVCQSLALRVDGVATPYTLSFEVHVDQPANVRLAFADLRLEGLPEGSEGRQYALTVHHVGGRKVLSSPATAVVVSTSDVTDDTAGEAEGSQSHSEDHSEHHLDHQPQPHSELLLEQPSDQLSQQQPEPQVEHESQSEHSLADQSDQSDQSLPSAVPHWPSLPPLRLSSSNLKRLSHGSVRFRVHTCSTDGDRPVIAQDTVSIHRLWAALAHPGHKTRISQQLSPTLTLHFSLTADNHAPTGQMSGGVTTDDGITGAHPIIFGTLLTDALCPSFSTSGLPSGWVRMVDTFGYRYYRHVKQAVDVWIRPPGEAISEAIRNDELTARQLGYERGKHGTFRSLQDGSETWIHPAAARSSTSTYGIQYAQPASIPSDNELSLSTLDSADLHEQPLSRSTHAARVRSDLHPATFTSSQPVASSEETAGRLSLDSRDVPLGRVVEMKWKPLPLELFAPGVKCEGHTLTAVNSGKTLLKFGGSTGSGGTRLNTLDAFDVETFHWRRLNVQGVLPAARTGHGAVALGADQSRLLIFGGSSPQGRRNDLHMYHVANETWSPVTWTGTPPEIRARMGMTVAADASTALVFGGRSLYRFLGGQYYDSHYVNAFHAERSQWVRMKPQGTGPRPAPRSGCVVEFINHRQMLVHGGYDDGDRFFDDTFVFDMVSSSWQKIAYPNEPTGPSPREGHASVMMGDKVFVCGGDSRNGLLSDVHMFNCSTMRWEKSPSVVGRGPGRITGAGLAAIGDSEALLVGGDTGFNMTRAAYTLGVSRRSTIDAQSMKELAMERGPDAQSCVVCLDAKVNTMFLWCGHSVCCRSCSRLVKHICPVCRQPFSEIVHSRF